MILKSSGNFIDPRLLSQLLFKSELNDHRTIVVIIANPLLCSIGEASTSIGRLSLIMIKNYLFIPTQCVAQISMSSKASRSNDDDLTVRQPFQASEASYNSVLTTYDRSVPSDV